ncbi:hypothetical protein ICN42_04910 [Polynucleobacter sp. 71A-WALBACH]|uniref:hypothetical protein n=1 Tax=Polynucleobacter sp. 71A-WALBACH TaxID=2689097 RepID=UPI001C0D59EC|nr:hypothetical protein [Polynucleobacter sp. 71A-WALBACH]MBU3593437.1 hypothetical protein [Polynucleobacter sp. 71A-WALBACH]
MREKYSRQEILDLIWALPISKVSSQLGIADSALSKWCSTADVPKPPMGHWIKKELGKPVPEKPLLNAWNDGDEPEFSTLNNLQKIKKPAKPKSLVKPIPAAETLEASDFSLAEDEFSIYQGRSFHPVIEQTFKDLDKSKTNRFGRWESASGFDVQISPDNTPRAKRILQTILNIYLNKGAEVKNYQRWSNSSSRPVLVIDGESIQFSFYETATRHIPPLRRQSSYMSYDGNRRTYMASIDYTASGKLELKISHVDLYSERTLKDSSNKSVEEGLSAISEIVSDLMVRGRAERIEREAKELERERLRKIEQNKADEIERKKRQWQELQENASEWAALQEIRAFINAVKADRYFRKKHPDWRLWVSWASDQVNRRDPIYKIRNGKALPGTPI